MMYLLLLKFLSVKKKKKKNTHTHTQLGVQNSENLLAGRLCFRASGVKLRETSISFNMSVCISAWNSAHTREGLIKFDN